MLDTANREPQASALTRFKTKIPPTPTRAHTHTHNLHGVLPWTPKVVPLGLGTLLKDPRREDEVPFKGSLQGYNLRV